jgi:AhpD family alkylhydroperoxidase
MARISKLPLEKWDPELRSLSHADTAMPVEREGQACLAHAPHIAKAMGAFMATAMKDRKLSRRLLELVRIRVAFHNQCRHCMAVRYQSALDDGFNEDIVCSLERPEESPDLTEREKAALAYADLFATNHLAINDDTFAMLRKHYSEAEIVELAGFVAFFVGFGRLGAVMNEIEQLPKGFQDQSKKVAPWKIRESVVIRG